MLRGHIKNKLNMLSRLEVPRPPTISGHFSKDLPPQALNV
jgi:hypothetical protein